MKRKCLEGDGCPVARALDVVGDWWTLLIIRDAFAGVTRFGDFQKHLGVAKNILATRLKDMVEQGLLQTSEVGARSEYQLTDKGRALMPVLVTLAQWGGAHATRTGRRARAGCALAQAAAQGRDPGRGWPGAGPRRYRHAGQLGAIDVYVICGRAVSARRQGAGSICYRGSPAAPH